MLSIPLSHPNNTLMTMNGIVIGEYVQPEREYINDSPDLEAYANVGSANRLSDDN